MIERMIKCHLLALGTRTMSAIHSNSSVISISALRPWMNAKTASPFVHLVVMTSANFQPTRVAEKLPHLSPLSMCVLRVVLVPKP